MRKVIGIGETILDIIFRDNQPTAAVPGGSVFNGIVSLSRTGVPVCFISETGNDRVGDLILRFMRDNHIPTDHVNVFPDGKSPVSLAFLDEHSDAEYIFYKNYPAQRLDVAFPRLEEDDIVVIGSYYALNPVLRDKVVELLEQARQQKAIVYYDPNFRSAHKEEAIKLAPTIIENLEYADIVRGSQDDFFYMYGLRDAERIYKEKIKFYCPNFLCTRGSGEVTLRTATLAKSYPALPLEAVSTIGAGDNFNAGITTWTRRTKPRGTSSCDAEWSSPPMSAAASATPSRPSLQPPTATRHTNNPEGGASFPPSPPAPLTGV